MSAPKFNARIAIATAFSTQGGTLLQFEIQPLCDEGEEIIVVEDDEAEYWGIYARIQETDGSGAPAHWIADIDKKAEAQALCDILNYSMQCPRQLYTITDNVSDHKSYILGTPVWIAKTLPDNYFEVTDGKTTWTVGEEEISILNTNNNSFSDHSPAQG